MGCVTRPLLDVAQKRRTSWSRSVFHWSLTTSYRLGGALGSFWQVRGYFSEGRTFLERILTQSEGSLPSLRAKALNDAVLLAVSQGDHDWGEALCQENLARYRELGDGGAIARTLYLLGWITLSKGNLATAHSRLSESLALFREVGDKGGSSYRSSGWRGWSSDKASMPEHVCCSSGSWPCRGS